MQGTNNKDEKYMIRGEVWDGSEYEAKNISLFNKINIWEKFVHQRHLSLNIFSLKITLYKPRVDSIGDGGPIFLI